MNFPVFGDAEANAIGGQACAAVLEAGASILSCIDRDPLGKMAYFALPYRLSKDPVVIDHLTLALKILVFMLFITAAARILRMLSESDRLITFTQRPLRVGITVISVLLLAICLNNIPVRLADMEAACCAMIAVGFALAALRDVTERNTIPDLYIFLACLFMDFGGLFKQSFFAREFLLIMAFALCLRLPILVRFIKDWRTYVVITLANLGAGLQLYYVWVRFGAFGLTTPGVMDAAAKARHFPIIGMEIFTLPEKGVFLLWIFNASPISWFFYKIYYALVTTDLFVYGGYAKRSSTMISIGFEHWILVYCTVILFLALIAASITYGSRAVRLVTMVAFFNIIFMTAFQHVEPRYHIFPKALLVIVAVYWVMRAWTALSVVRSRSKIKLAGSASSDFGATPQVLSARSTTLWRRAIPSSTADSPNEAAI